MIRKNNEFLVQKAVKLLKDDPRTTLATDGETPAAVLEALEQEGYHVEELEYNAGYYDKALADARRSAGRKLRVRGGFCRGSGEA